MIEDSGIGMTIGSGTVGVICGFLLNFVRVKYMQSPSRADFQAKSADPSRCTELHARNQVEHDGLFIRMSAAEVAIVASRATQESMSKTMDRVEEKLDKVLYENRQAK